MPKIHQNAFVGRAALGLGVGPAYALPRLRSHSWEPTFLSSKGTRKGGEVGERGRKGRGREFPQSQGE